MKKVIKIAIILLIMIFGFQFNINKSNATNWEEYKPSEPNSQVENVFYKRAGIVIGAIRSVGILVSIGASILIGIKIAISSVEEKAEYKQKLPGYIIGIVLVMAISLLPTIIYEVMKDIE